MPRISQPELMLTEAHNELQDDWRTARAEWLDSARASFDEEVMEEIGSAVRLAVDALSELTQLMKRVVRECS
ncbi:MAG: hypothetical protein MUE73_11085 [Planctomycetes bacterium]|jgi:hypothetical protein|nr:hypothetical protein [Planctomycetota bacterium]